MTKKKLITLLLILVLSLNTLVGCSANDPIREDMYIDGDIYTWNGDAWVPLTPGDGDVVGPAGCNDEAIARYHGLTGKIIQGSNVNIDNFGNLTANNGDITATVGDINAGNDLNCVNDLNVTDDADINGALWVDETSTFDGQIILTNQGLVWIEFRPDLDPTKLAKNSLPSAVERGIAYGYSLPIGGADEELFYSICIPGRWDEESDIHVHVYAWLDTAQDEANDAVKLQLEWEHVSIDDLLPNTSNIVTDEEVVGIVGQYRVVQFNFTIDYDIDVGDAIEDDDTLFFRLTRVASSHEIVGEPVVFHSSVIFRCDKLGNPTHE